MMSASKPWQRKWCIIELRAGTTLLKVQHRATHVDVIVVLVRRFTFRFTFIGSYNNTRRVVADHWRGAPEGADILWWSRS